MTSFFRALDSGDRHIPAFQDDPSPVLHSPYRYPKIADIRSSTQLLHYTISARVLREGSGATTSNHPACLARTDAFSVSLLTDSSVVTGMFAGLWRGIAGLCCEPISMGVVGAGEM